MMDYKNILTGVADRLSSLREERPSAGTKYRLMGVAADISEVTECLSKEALEALDTEKVVNLIHHSDRGIQYVSAAAVSALAVAALQCCS